MNYTPELIDPRTLYFDHSNPRIAEFNITEQTPEEEIIGILWHEMGVDEIVMSIKSSGFFANESLVAVRENGRNIVIEGNRRLAAIKCLLNPSLADYIGINKNILFATEEVLASIEQIPVIFVDERKEAWKFIGFKHINGPAKWGSYAKAQYISQIKNEYQIPLNQIAVQIGDTHRTVQKLYQGLQVIEQAESLGKFSRTDINAPRLYFSHLYTGLNYEGVKDFLGIKDVSEETANPVPANKQEELELLLLWLFGSKSKNFEPVIKSQNPDLRYLDEVVKNKEATYALKEGESLVYAYEISQPKEKTFEQSLLDAKRALQRSHSFQTEGFNGTDESLLRLSASVAKLADELYSSMELKWEQLQNKGIEKKRRFSED
ncbi:hypothetical protein [Pontibacter kalidii]|uniref:hypothetical protein n=1 Tax=Pontibacter kalidii TaxID=2592049 RepID=UPI002253AEE6|nr:hypothetical protein [Pontibacter kalidii]